MLAAGLLATLIASPDRALAQLTLPNVTVPGITVPGIITLPGITVALPNGSVPGVDLLNTVGLLPSLNLPPNVLLINLPGVSILLPDLLQLASLGNSAIGLVLNQVAPVNQTLAAATHANVMTPVGQLLDSLITRGSEPLSGGTSPAPTALKQLGMPNLWMWNAATAGRADHDGFGFQTGGGGAQVSGGTLPTRSIDKAMLPGVLWDASQFFGMKRGIFHIGLSAGALESDVEIKSTEILRSAGIGQAGSASITSWSLGAFALLTPGPWYTGAVVGGSRGRTETENFVLRASADYDTSGFLSAWIVGTVLPITSTIRFDVRGTLGYQRTFGEAHVDTLGIGYGDHTIEAVTGNLSGRLFGVLRQGSLTMRPFVQGGVAHRFHYDNGLRIGGADFTFDDADNSVFAATGIDFELNSLQLSAGVRHEHSSDADSLSARFGVTLKLN